MQNRKHGLFELDIPRVGVEVMTIMFNNCQFSLCEGKKLFSKGIEQELHKG